jgi:hypothetical protein
MRCDHDVRRCACTKRAAQVSSGRSAGPRSPSGGNRSGSQGARGRHCGNAQDSASKPHLNCCAKSPTAWKNSGSNNRIHRGIFWIRSQQIDRNCHSEPITKSRTYKVIKRGVVSRVSYRAKSSRATALVFPSSLKPGVPTSIRGDAYSTKFSEHQVYRLIEMKRLPAGELCAQLVASPAAIRERLAMLANADDAGDPNGYGPQAM